MKLFVLFQRKRTKFNGCDFLTEYLYRCASLSLVLISSTTQPKVLFLHVDSRKTELFVTELFFWSTGTIQATKTGKRYSCWTFRSCRSGCKSSKSSKDIWGQKL